MIESYKALRDRAPYPPSHVVSHLQGNFAFIVFDKSTSTLFVAIVSNWVWIFTNMNIYIYRIYIYLKNYAYDFIFPPWVSILKIYK